MMRNPRVLLRAVGIIAAVFLIAGYAYFETRGLIRGPVVAVEYPVPGSTVADELVTVSGTVLRVTDIALNDRPIFIDADGRWSEMLLLAPGYNVLELSVADRFGRTRRELIELVYRPHETPPIATTTEVLHATTTATTSNTQH